MAISIFDKEKLEAMHKLPAWAQKGRERMIYIVGNCLATGVGRGAKSSGTFYPDNYDLEAIVMDEFEEQLATARREAYAQGVADTVYQGIEQDDAAIARKAVEEFASKINLHGPGPRGYEGSPVWKMASDSLENQKKRLLSWYESGSSRSYPSNLLTQPEEK